MTRRMRLAVTAVIVCLALGVLAPQAQAIYPQGSGDLSGPAIGGVTPEGDARFDQSEYPSEPPLIETRVKNVNLPDGTTLFVGLGCEYHNCPDYRQVALFTLQGRSGNHTSTVRVSVGRQDRLMVSTADGTVVLQMTEPWKT